MQWAILATLPLVLTGHQDTKPKEKKKMEVIIKKPEQFLRDRLNIVEFASAMGDTTTHVVVFPRGNVDSVRLGSNRFGIIGKPGKYMLFAMTWSNNPGEHDPVEFDEEFTIVESGSTPAPKPGPMPDPVKYPDPAKLVGRLQMGNAGCTAVPITTDLADAAPRSKWLLTAAHCIPAGIARGTWTSPAGERFQVVVRSVAEKPDVAILEILTDGQMPRAAVLSPSRAAPGAEVFHGGFGVDRPGNIERGSYVAETFGTGQSEFRLSVSSGDSGGPIWSAETNRVLATVCCTTERGKVARVFGGNVESISEAINMARGSAVDSKHQPMLVVTPRDDGEWKPLEIPLRK